MLLDCKSLSGGLSFGMTFQHLQDGLRFGHGLTKGLLRGDLKICIKINYGYLMTKASKSS